MTDFSLPQDTRDTYIYALIDSKTQEIKYIGKTVSPLNSRLSAHLHDAKNPKCQHWHKCRWINKLLRDGARPLIKALEVVPYTGDWASREAYWIKRMRSEGHRITNLTDGGEGTTGYVPTEATRIKQSKSSKGRIVSEETKKLMAANSKRYWDENPEQAKALQQKSIEVRTIKFPQEALDLLGKMSDADIGRKFNIKSATVALRRRKLGIPRYVPEFSPLKFVLPDDCIALIGIEQDAVLARKYGVSEQVINRKRTELGLKAIGPKKKDVPQGALELLGTMSDAKIAKKFGISNHMVGRARQDRNIPAYEVYKWKESDIKLIGTMPDYKLAKQLGIGCHLVSSKRNALHIPKFKHFEITDEIISLMGTMPDYKLADIANCTTMTISKFRRKLEIPSYMESIKNAV